ncbi:MAG: precorrin-3B C(17)-methyltransferase [Coriobacteriales bacterium]|nr:precorrin-3B C(17)-methyltransferase [Coriobacteriales bacterium]
MGKLYIVGLGPGNAEHMTIEAVEALKEADLVCGYPVYVELAKQVAPSTETFTTPMTREVERCRAALGEAASGKSVAMVCSGDAGVYGMSGLIYELAGEYPPIEIVVISGVTAALSGGAVLGAPLTHDFCVISLSDLLTPWEKIEKRLEAAAAADFCTAIYNPMSRKRKDHLNRACQIMLQHKSPQTVCGYVRNIGREGEESWIGTLEELADLELDMFCTVFIGNSQTKEIDGKMVTPRGYEKRIEEERQGR